MANGPMQARDGVVTEIIHEAPEVVSVRIDTGEENAFIPGQFLSIDPHQFDDLAEPIAKLQAARGRKETRRCLSLSNVPGEAAIQITVKIDRGQGGHKGDGHPPLLGPYLADGLSVGQRVLFMGYSGRYVLPEALREAGGDVLHLVGGAGIIPNFSIVKADLLTGRCRHTVLYGARTWGDVIFGPALARLSQAYPERLKVLHCLSQDVSGAPDGSHAGRIDADLVSAHLARLSAPTVMICGPSIKPREKRAARKRGETLPDRFMEAMLAMVEGAGINADRVLKERW